MSFTNVVPGRRGACQEQLKRSDSFYFIRKTVGITYSNDPRANGGSERKDLLQDLNGQPTG